ncbi:unnamed protein product [Ectocarpus sp. 13 AM-2016]
MNDWSSYRYRNGDDMDNSYHYSYELSQSESVAALELTYTASDEDYLYGTPAHSYYDDEDLVVGRYTSGESRAQTVFAGRDGSWGDTCTMQAISGQYLSIDGDSTIGIHRSWMETGDATGGVYGMQGNRTFPDGIECMIAGVVTYME